MRIFFALFALVHLFFILSEYKTSMHNLNEHLYQRYGFKEGDVLFFANEKTKVTRQYSFVMLLYSICAVYGWLKRDFIFVILNVLQLAFTLIDICHATHRLNMLCAGEVLDEREDRKKPFNLALNSVYVLWLIVIILN